MIIGICGNNGAGKNTVGQFAQNVFEGSGYHFYLVAFADALYAESSFLFDTPEKDVCEKYRELKELRDPRWGGKTVREVLIALGGFVRSIVPDYWVKRLQKNMVPVRNYIITDVRYENEADICDVLIEVGRPGFTENTGDLVMEIDDNEEVRDDWFIISNKSDKAYLHEEVRQMIEGHIMSEKELVSKIWK